MHRKERSQVQVTKFQDIKFEATKIQAINFQANKFHGRMN